MLGGSLRALQVEGERRINGAPVQAAFVLGETAPATGAAHFPGTDGARAGPATDAGIAPGVERVHGDVVGADVGPDVGAGPPQEGIHLDEAEPRVAFNRAARGPPGGLAATDGRDPGLK